LIDGKAGHLHALEPARCSQYVQVIETTESFQIGRKPHHGTSSNAKSLTQDKFLPELQSPREEGALQHIPQFGMLKPRAAVLQQLTPKLLGLQKKLSEHHTQPVFQLSPGLGLLS
jgi:hypothetical protein